MKYSKKTLDKYLREARRISNHRTAGAEKQIRTIFKNLIKDLTSFLGSEFAKYDVDQMTFDYLAQKGRYAKFIEEVAQKVDGFTPDIKKTATELCQGVYETSYQYMAKAVQGALGYKIGYTAVTPEVLKRAVQNPISGLTLKDTLEKNRAEIIYNAKRTISIGLTRGDRYSTMAKSIAKTLDSDYKKAIRIVRTEAHRVSQSGQHDSATDINNQAKENNLDFRMVKKWVTMSDEKVRPKTGLKKGGKVGKAKSAKADHTKMDGVTVGLDEKFDLGRGVKADAPGNSGDAANDINCRCFLEYDIVDLE